MWKKIIIGNLETNYSVSDQGEIRNDKSNYILKPYIQNGYAHVTLYINKKSKRVSIHRMVALAFIPNPDNKEYVNHIDGIKSHNVVNNLEWATPSENTIHAVKTGLKKPTRERGVVQYDLQGNKIAEYISLSEAARQTNSNAEKIILCCQRLRTTHNNFQWRYSSEANETLQSVSEPKTKSKKVAQIDPNTNEIIATYDSMTQAAKAVNGTASAIINIVNHKKQTKTHKGYKWELVNEIVH